MATPSPKRRRKPTPTTAAKPAPRTNMVPLQIRVKPDLMARIERFANAEGISVSAYARRILINQVPGG